MNRGRFDAAGALTPRGGTPAEEGVLTLVPGRNQSGFSVLGSLDLPVFCPDSKHAASLQRVSHVCADLEHERARIVLENEEVIRKKAEVLEEMAEVEERCPLLRVCCGGEDGNPVRGSGRRQG
jgi:hypothetical protein